MAEIFLICNAHIDCGYHSDPGTARKKIEQFISAHPGLTPMLIPWGSEITGGGPSRADIRDVNALMVETGEHQIRHATPEAFFADLAGQRETLPAVTASLRPFAVGCYTSQIRVKQRHRLLEAMLERAGRMAADALCRCGTPWPEAPFRLAEEDLLKAEFHDILPGSGICDAEEYALRVMDHGLEILDRIQTEAFFRLAANESRALPGETAVLVWNPWPFPLETVVETEFMLEDAEERHGYFEAAIHQGGAVLPTQVVKKRSNMAWEWRKRVAFRAVLQPLQMNRFDIHVTNVVASPEIDRHSFVFDSDDLHAEVDPLLACSRATGSAASKRFPPRPENWSCIRILPIPGE